MQVLCQKVSFVRALRLRERTRSHRCVPRCPSSKAPGGAKKKYNPRAGGVRAHTCWSSQFVTEREEFRDFQVTESARAHSYIFS